MAKNLAKKSTGKKSSAKKPSVRKALVKAAKGKAAKPKSVAKQKKADAEAFEGTAKRWTAAQIDEAFRRFQVQEPEPKGELKHTNPFTLLVAVVLSAQATDAGVNKATPALFALADTPEKMVALGEDRIRDLIKTIGLFRMKAKNVALLAKKLVDEFGGEVPRTRDELVTLPGAGRKTANVVLNMAFGQPTMAVDTHIFRIGNRTGLAPGKDVLAVELELEKVIPATYMQHAHHWLILHGRYICIARKPHCDRCIIADLCQWPGKTASESFRGVTA